MFNDDYWINVSNSNFFFCALIFCKTRHTLRCSIHRVSITKQSTRSCQIISQKWATVFWKIKDQRSGTMDQRSDTNHSVYSLWYWQMISQKWATVFWKQDQRLQIRDERSDTNHSVHSLWYWQMISQKWAVFWMIDKISKINHQRSKIGNYNVSPKSEQPYSESEHKIKDQSSKIRD